jgi:NADH-quinone oxidoreductase subunit J
LPPVGQAFGSPAAVGDLLFSEYILPFEVTSLLLLVAMVGAIVLTRRPKRTEAP